MARSTRNWLMSLILGLFLTPILPAAQWTSLGPEGGDVRSLAYDPSNPDHIFLGTSTGVLFVSNDGGRSWNRFAHLGSGDDYVLDHIAFDPQNSKKIYVSAWSFQSQQTGDVFRTHDGGKNWEALSAMHGKSVRALAVSASDTRVLVAGALDGVYRSSDGGNNWQRISPANHADIKNVESIAVDPQNPNVVYAGTWHLAWKTPDGGATWEHIKKGMIDDSDVFSIIVDKANPSVVFASACSGIYKSENAGALFSKIQGIPFSARRTRVLKQDPSNSAIVYAGTTEGLWKSMDSGKTWKRVSNPEVVVNDVLVDSRNSQRVLLATDRMGVLASNDGVQTLVASNQGYSHRYISAIEPDRNDPKIIYVGLINDQQYGGVFVSPDGGAHWQQKSAGLGGRDVFSLSQAGNGTLVAGTNRGIFLLAPNANEWRPSNTIVTEKGTPRIIKSKGKSRKVMAHSAVRSVLNARVSDIEIAPNRWLAATSAGLFASSDQGKIWSGGPVMGKQDLVAVRANRELIVTATRTNVFISADGGTDWKQAPTTSLISSIYGVTICPDSHIFLATREGAFHSTDAGASWEHMMNGIPAKEIGSITCDGKRLLATSNASGVVFESFDNGHSWYRGSDSGYTIRALSVVRGRLLAATPFDGVVAQPDKESQSASAGGGSK
ncbi:MAG TPA: transcriptional regulator [Terriglobales bacterium]|nr:transcriptional regulator [Terriglobales bacterium]